MSMRGYIGNFPDGTPIDVYQAMRGNIGGLALSNNGADAVNDIDVASGGAMDAGVGGWMELATGITKRLDATWVVGTNQGGLDTGAVANGTYHVWLIKRIDTGVVDVLFSLSPTSPTMPANYTLKRRIGSIVRVSAAIKAFSQVGDYFAWNAAASDLNGGALTTANRTARTLTVPTGIKVLARVAVSARPTAANSAFHLAVSDLDATADTAVSLAYFSIGGSDQTSTAEHAAESLYMTNTSGQIGTRASAAGTHSIVTHGWFDTRGRHD